MVNNRLFCKYLVLNSDRDILRHQIEDKFGVDMSNIVTDEGIYNTLISLLKQGKDEAYKKMMTFHPDILRYDRVVGNMDKESVIEKSQKQDNTENKKFSMQKIIDVAFVIELSLLTALTVKMLFAKKE